MAGQVSVGTGTPTTRGVARITAKAMVARWAVLLSACPIPPGHCFVVFFAVASAVFVLGATTRKDNAGDGGAKSGVTTGSADNHRDTAYPSVRWMLVTHDLVCLAGDLHSRNKQDFFIQPRPLLFQLVKMIS